MRNSKLGFATLVQDFFCNHLRKQRNLSHCTVAAYRDTFRILLGFFKTKLGKLPTDIMLEDLTVATVEAFLQYLESERKNTIRTRNNRFAALRSFLRYVAIREPSSLGTIQQVLAMPMKRYSRRQLGFLSKSEVQAILDASDVSRWAGQRDNVMFTTLYNTGARVSELAALRQRNVTFGNSAAILIHGKGRKERVVPLWKTTAKRLSGWIQESGNKPEAALFPNSRGVFMTRSGIEHRLKKTVGIAATSCPSLIAKRVSPHTIRHTTAMHLLQSGVDMTVIAMWLGHESTETTHVYVEADLAMKSKALSKLDEPNSKSPIYKPSDKLLAFLDNL